jgi:hypothetical protein
VSTAISLLTKSRKSPREIEAKSNENYHAESVHLHRKHAVAVLRNRM